MDDYIFSELSELISVVKKALDEYKPDIATKEFLQFLEILNNWYIRLNRERFWNEDQIAFDTLYTVIINLCKTLAPFAPFISDYIYRNLTGKESVHLEAFPCIKTAFSTKLLGGMRQTQNIVSVGKQLRENYKLRNRLPLKSLMIAGADMNEFSYIS